MSLGRLRIGPMASALTQTQRRGHCWPGRRRWL